MSKMLTEQQLLDERRKNPRIFYPFGKNGKTYSGQKFETIKCPECKTEYEVSVVESYDPQYVGFCQAKEPNKCPNCNQKFWYRAGFEKS